MITVKFTACWTHEIVMVSTNTFSARGWDFLLKNICTLKDIYSIKVLGLRYKYQIKVRGGGPRPKKTSLAYIKVQTVMQLLLLTESQNLHL